MPKKWRPGVVSRWFCCLITLIFIQLTIQSVMAQEPVNEADSVVDALLKELSPEERVGQLFMVTFEGSDVSEASDIASLVRDYRIGGVWLRPSNRPTSVGNKAQEQRIQTLINNLQRFTFQMPVNDAGTISNPDSLLETSVVTASIPLSDTRLIYSAINTDTVPIPLFIAADYSGNSNLDSLLTARVFEVPSGMVLGATWNPENARQVGSITGQKLSALGVNMLFGPILDVLDQPKPDVAGTVGVHSLGGNPYWVSQLGKAYIHGVHQGSEGRLIAVAKHFPGAGSIDRRLNQDIPTTQKTLEALKQTELAPFYAVANLETDNPATIVDGLMTTHIRYKGLQENVREATLPISLDAQNLPLVFEDPELAPWREGGGLLVSAPLGVPAIQKIYLSENEVFPAIEIARNAFLAGNDLILLSTFGPVEDATVQINNIIEVIEFFQDNYETDPDFQQQVDQAVSRILKAKLALYQQQFTLPHVLRSPELLETVPGNTETLTRITRESVTLLFPGPAELADRIPSTPRNDETIIIFTDARKSQACVTCDPIIPQDAIEQIMLARYGPGAGDQVSDENIHSYTFLTLKDAMDSDTPPQLELERDLEAADWVIFAMLDVDEDYDESNVVKLFLSERSRDLRDKKHIIMAFDAPYYIDETEVSLLTAYYGIYNHTQRHLDAAVRALFKEFQPQGRPPVNVDAVEYDLAQALKPDPGQVIELTVFKEDETPSPPETTPVETPTPAGEAPSLSIPGQVGDRFVIETGLIYDQNGNPVPDGTVVSFRRLYPTEDLTLVPLSAETVAGIARIVIPLERPLTLQIEAASEPAQSSNTITIVGAEEPETTPQPLPTESTPVNSSDSLTQTTETTPTLIAAVATTSVSSPPTAAEITSTDDPLHRQLYALSFVDLFYSLLMVIAVGGIYFWVLARLNIALETRVGMIILALSGGLTGYVFYGIFVARLAQVNALGSWVRGNATFHILTPSITLVFALIGGGIGFLGWYIRSRREEAR